MNDYLFCRNTSMGVFMKHLNKKCIGLPQQIQLHILIICIQFCQVRIHFRKNLRKAGRRTGQDKTLETACMPFGPSGKINTADIRISGIRQPYFRITLFGKLTDITYHTANRKLYKVKFKMTPYCRLYPTKQTTSNTLAYHSLFQPGLESNLIIGLSGKKSKLKYLPEISIGIKQLTVDLFSSPRNHSEHTPIFTDGRYGFCSRERIENLLYIIKRQAAVITCIFILLFINTRPLHIKRTVTIHFRLVISRFCIQQNDNHHHYRNSKCRTGNTDGRK